MKTRVSLSSPGLVALYLVDRVAGTSAGTRLRGAGPGVAERWGGAAHRLSLLRLFRRALRTSDCSPATRKAELAPVKPPPPIIEVPPARGSCVFWRPVDAPRC